MGALGHGSAAVRSRQLPGGYYAVRIGVSCDTLFSRWRVGLIENRLMTMLKAEPQRGSTHGKPSWWSVLGGRRRKVERHRARWR